MGSIVFGEHRRFNLTLDKITLNPADLRFYFLSGDEGDELFLLVKQSRDTHITVHRNGEGFTYDGVCGRINVTKSHTDDHNWLVTLYGNTQHIGLFQIDEP